MTIRKTIAFACVLLAAASSMNAEQSPTHAQAIRLNNRGVALMGQQFTERAAETFAEAFKIDPTLVQAEINEGIAQLTLEELGKAEELLQNATFSTPTARRLGTTSASFSTTPISCRSRCQLSACR